MYMYMCKCITAPVSLFSAMTVSECVIKRTMSLQCYLQSCSSLPTPQQMGIGEQATTEANTAAEEVTGDSGHCNGRKRKRYTAFSDENRAAIGRHASESSNVSAL